MLNGLPPMLVGAIASVLMVLNALFCGRRYCCGLPKPGSRATVPGWG